MKTIFIYDQLGESPISFFVLDGDYRRLDDIYINSYLNEDEKEKAGELCAVLAFDDIKFLDKFPLEIAKQQDVFVINVGFVP